MKRVGFNCLFLVVELKTFNSQWTYIEFHVHIIHRMSLQNNNDLGYVVTATTILCPNFAKFPRKA